MNCIGEDLTIGQLTPESVGQYAPECLGQDAPEYAAKGVENDRTRSEGTAKGGGRGGFSHNLAQTSRRILPKA